jgi:hypothetical protein
MNDLTFSPIDTWTTGRLSNASRSGTAVGTKVPGLRASQQGAPTPVQIISLVKKNNNLIISFVVPQDSTFEKVNVFLTGYQGNKSPVQLTSGMASPITYPVTSGGGPTTVTLQSVGKDGTPLQFANCPSKGIVL